MTVATLKMAMGTLAEPHSHASDVARRLGITRTTLYTYVTSDGSVKEVGPRLLEGEQPQRPRKARQSA